MFGRSLQAATHLGDAALLLPASLALFVILWLRAPRAALLWAGVLVACLSAMLAAKLAFYGCGPRFQSPSGHAAFGTLFYGCAALVVGAGQPRPMRALILVGALLAVAGVTVSRVWLRVHSAEEVAAGLLVGALGVAAFARFRPPLDRAVLTPPLLGAGLVALLLLVGGRHLGVEHWVGRAARLMPALDLCS